MLYQLSYSRLDITATKPHENAPYPLQGGIAGGIRIKAYQYTRATSRGMEPGGRAGPSGSETIPQPWLLSLRARIAHTAAASARALPHQRGQYDASAHGHGIDARGATGPTLHFPFRRVLGGRSDAAPMCHRKGPPVSWPGHRRIPACEARDFLPARALIIGCANKKLPTWMFGLVV